MLAVNQIRGVADGHGARFGDLCSLIRSARMNLNGARFQNELGADYGAVGAGDIDIVGALLDAVSGDDDDLGAGDIDIVGDGDDLIRSILSGDDDDMGAMVPRHVRAAMHGHARAHVKPHIAQAIRKAKIMRALRAVDPRAKMLRRADKYIHRRQNIGASTSVDVPIGGTFTITIQPQRPFKCMRWIVSSDVAFFFDITDVKVGQVSQFAASSVVPASSFTEQARDANVEWDTADIGNLIVISGTNVHTAPHPFRSNLIGVSLVPQF